MGDYFVSKTDQPVIQLVVGVHRSGTSVSTQVLSVLGLDLGRTLMLPAFDNPRGFWENSKVVAAHDRLFAALGVDWTTAAALPDQWAETEAADAAVAELIEVVKTDFDAETNKLIKDPRMAVLLPLWSRVAEGLGHDLHVIGALRRPSKIKASIAKRNGFSDDVADVIVQSQLASMDKTLAPHKPPVILFERLTALSAKDIVSAITSVLPHLKIDATQGMTDMISRIVGKRESAADEGDKDYESLLSSAAEQLFVEWPEASTYLSSVTYDDKLLNECESLLPKSAKMLTVPEHRLNALKQAEEQNVQLLSDYKRLEGEFDDKAETLKSYVGKMDAIQESFAEERSRTTALDKAVQERDAKIRELTVETNSVQDLRETLTRYEAEITNLRVSMESGDATRAKTEEHIGRLQAEIESKIKDSEGAKSQRDRLNLEIRELRETSKSLKARETELSEVILNLKTKLTEADAHRAELTKDVRRLNKNLKSAKTRHAKKIATQQSEIEARGDELDFLKDSISDLKGNLIETRQREASFESELNEKTRALGDASHALNRLGGDLYETKEALKTTEKTLAETSRIKEMQDTTIEMETLRSRMVEDEYAAKVSVLENRLSYFERAPMRAGLKSFLFSTLRLIRRGLPLPEMMKLRMARKMTGLAQRLQPPATQINPEAAVPKTDNTINFAFPEVENPVISIIVPVYNEISQTIACLKSIYQQRVSCTYEVIIADDASPDPFHKILKDIPGIRYVRHPQNLHFLLNCNRAAEHARGEYLIFLNNDTLVKPGWMENLLATFREHGNVGIAGSKLVYPTGELQEAGGIIWEDASGWNWGKGQNADHPIYNFVRDVDYISGASLMIPTELWKEIGGFNEELEKAYYEDADLCFKVREMGYRVVYQPSSVVVHIEGLSSGTDLNAGAKQYQLVNQKIFKERWAEPLKRHLPNAQTPFLASDRSVKGHILYIDAETPEPDKDAGSVNSVYAMRILVEQGYRVHFVPGSNFAYWGKATQALQALGIECVYHPFYSNLDMFIDDRGDMFDYAIVSRAESADLFLDKIKERLPSAKTIYNTVDMHFLRMQRRAETTGDAEVAAAADVMRARELSYIEKADATIILSSVEEEVLRDLGVPEEKLWLVPLIRPHSERLVEYDTTEDMLFIGGYKHPPNVDAVDWMMEKIWPHIEEALPGVNLRICGSSMPERFQSYASDSVIIQGFVPDLDALLSKTRLTLAPLRFGAGLKGKVASSIGVGVPVVGTSIAFEGMAEEGLAEVILKEDDPKAFAELAVKAYMDQEIWTGISYAGVDYHNANYAYQNIAKHYAAMLDWAKEGTAETAVAAE